MSTNTDADNANDEENEDTKRNVPRKHYRLNNRPPQSLEAVQNIAESEVIYYHDAVEEKFENEQFEVIEKELLGLKKSEDMSELITKIYKKWGVNSESIKNYSEFERHVENVEEVPPVLFKSDHYPRICKYGKLIEQFSTMYTSMEERIYFTIKGNLIRYCVSLAEICKTNIDFVQNYENHIQKKKGEILKEMEDLNKSLKTFKSCTNNFAGSVTAHKEVFSCIRQVRASLNKLYYLVTEWVDEDRHYMETIISNLHETQTRHSELYDKIQAQETSLQHDYSVVCQLDEELKNDRLNHAQLRKQQTNCQQREEDVKDHIVSHENQITATENALHSVNDTIGHLEQRIRYYEEHKRLHNESPIFHELRGYQLDKNSIEKHLSRVKDSKEALERQLERLQDQIKALQKLIDNKKSEITEKKDLFITRQDAYKEKIPQHKSLIQEYRSLEPKMEDLKILRSKKPTMSTLRELHNFGHAISPRKDQSSVTKACRMVADHIGMDWKILYLNLPMKPDRSIEQRNKDIETIDLIAGRRHIEPFGQATMALDKWRLFYHRCTIEHLTYALRRSSNRALAAVVEKQFGFK